MCFEYIFSFLNTTICFVYPVVNLECFYIGVPGEIILIKNM